MRSSVVGKVCGRRVILFPFFNVRFFSGLMLQQAATLGSSFSPVVSPARSHVTPDGGRYHFITVGGLTSRAGLLSLRYFFMTTVSLRPVGLYSSREMLGDEGGWIHGGGWRLVRSSVVGSSCGNREILFPFLVVLFFFRD